MINLNLKNLGCLHRGIQSLQKSFFSTNEKWNNLNLELNDTLENSVDVTHNPFNAIIPSKYITSKNKPISLYINIYIWFIIVDIL